jgi:hypothetical protein
MCIYMFASWIVSLAIAVSATLILTGYVHNFRVRLSSDAFSLIVMFGCMGDRNMLLHPVIVASANAVASVVCICIYSCLCCKLKRIRQSPEVKHLEIRMAFIACINLIGWWPACIIYWYSYSKDETVFTGRIDPDVTIPVFLLTVIVSVANPIVYTVASKPFCALLKRCVCTRVQPQGEERQTPLIANSYEQESSHCCCMFKARADSNTRLHRARTTEDGSEFITSSYLFSETEAEPSNRLFNSIYVALPDT